MIKKTWIMWALFLLLPGVVGLGIEHAQKRARQNRIALATQRVADSPEVQEYLDMYEGWTDLPANEKADNPWGYGSYGGSDIQGRLKDGQSDRLLADIKTLEKGLSNYPEELIDVIYGSGWQQEIENYRNNQKTSEIILIAAIFLLATGGLILTGGATKFFVVYLINKRSESAAKDAYLPDEDVEEVSVDSKSDEESSIVADSTLQETVEEGTSSHEKTEETSSDQKIEETSLQNRIEDASLQESKDTASIDSKSKSKGYFQSSRKENQDPSAMAKDFKATDLPMKPDKPMFDHNKKNQKDSYFGWAIDSNESAELDTLMTTEPLTKELTELTEEVSAIRQFASQQQDQMRKLQDGYDWMIIRRFCLRIIRSIDNIDDRVTRLRADGDDAADYLEDIRDELVFALEASGIEQFGPDLNVTFKGLEKYAEAVRERVFTEDEELVGCIAEVARPGYQYLVSDDDVKIVRCAQVKLYETKQT